MRHSITTLALLAVSACAPTQTRPNVDVPTLNVIVDNKNFNDADVYLLSTYVKRLGTVTGVGNASRFVVRGIAPNTQVRLYARAIGQSREWRSEGILVYDGTTIRWTLYPNGGDALLPSNAGAH